MDALNKLNSVWKASKAAILNIPEIEQKVLDTTNNEKWGPTGQQMNEVARATFSYNDFPVIMEVIWRRLAERTPTDWRHVYKSLLLLEYILRNGSDQVITETRVHVYALERLSSYSAYEDGKDAGLSVRERAKAVLELVNDERRLRDERDKAAANRKKFQASISSEDYRGGYGGGGGGGGYGGDFKSYPSYDDPYGDNQQGGNNFNQWSQSPSNVQSRNAPPVQSFNSADQSVYNPQSNFNDQQQQQQPPKSILGLNANEDDDSSSDSDEDFIPKEAVKAASRPRAPSGGSSSTPKVQDLLGISALSSPQATPQTSSNFNPQFNAFDQQNVQQNIQQQQQQNSPFDFFPSQQVQQQGAQQQQQVQQQNMLSFGGPSPQTQSPAPSPQAQSPLVAAKTSSPAPSPVPSVDDKDPWKKAANLFNLDSLTDEISKPKEQPTTPQGYNNLRALQGPTNYNNQMNNNMNMNMNMNNNMNMNMNMGRGTPMMGNFNQQFPGQFGNPNPQFNQFGAQPNGQFMNPNPQFGNPNPQFNQFAMQNNMMGMNMNNNMNNNMNMNAGRGANPNNTFW